MYYYTASSASRHTERAAIYLPQHPKKIKIGTSRAVNMRSDKMPIDCNSFIGFVFRCEFLYHCKLRQHTSFCGETSHVQPLESGPKGNQPLLTEAERDDRTR